MPTTRVLTMIAALFVSTAFFAAGCGDDDGDSGPGSGKTIRLGSVFSVTGDGAAFGPQQVRGAQLAVNELNADDGIEGANVELRQMNDAGDAGNAIWGTRTLIGNFEVLALLGPTFSNSSAKAHPVANNARVPVVAVSNTAPGIVGDCDYPCDFIFRDSLAEADAIPANIKTYYDQASPDSAVVIHPADDAFGQSSAETARDEFANLEVRTSIIVFRPGKKSAVLTGNPKVVMVAASSGDAVVEIIRNLRKNGYKGKILAGNAANSTSVAETLGQDGKGVQSATAWYAGNDSEENQEFITAYRNQYGMTEPDQFAAQAYAGVELLAEAADEADLTFDDLAADRIALRNALEGVETDTPLGEFSFTADHDVNQPIWIVEMNGKGTFDLVKEIPAS